MAHEYTMFSELKYASTLLFWSCCIRIVLGGRDSVLPVHMLSSCGKDSLPSFNWTRSLRPYHLPRIYKFNVKMWRHWFVHKSTQHSSLVQVLGIVGYQ
jgi:hypothetical protein